MAKGAAPWKRVKFGEVVRLNKETCKDPVSAGIERVIGLEHLEPGDLRVRSWGDVADGTTFTNRVRPGQVLFGKRRAYQRKIAVAAFDAICSGDIYVLESANPSKLLPELLPFICQTDSFFEHAVGTSAGSLSPRTNWSSLAEYKFALPPLEDQRRMAIVLRARRDLVDRYADLAESVSATRRALGKQFFISHPEGSRSTVGSFGDVRNGTTPRRNVDAYWGGTIPWLPTGKVNERRITAADEFITEKALQECSLGGLLPVGACLVAMIGEGITRGKVARLELPACINQNFAAVVPGPNIDGWYLFYYLESHYESLRRWSQGTNQQALNCALVRAFPICVPGLSRQREIVAALREIDERGNLAAARLDEARAQLRQFSANLLSRGQA